MRQLKITKQVTNRDSRSLERYLNEVSKKDMVTAEEEVELAQRIQAGDERALNKLVNANLRFVISVAKQYQNQGLSLSDLINEGNVGLVKAAKRFDETRGFKFISYAVWWIRQSILQAIATHSRVVRLPLNKIGTISKMKKVQARLEQDTQRTPSVEELAEELDMSIHEVKTAIKHSGRHLSMDAPLKDGEDFNLYDVTGHSDTPTPDETLIQDSLKVEIDRALDKLPEREATVIRLYYGIGNNTSKSLNEIGELYDISRERVRQVKEKALRKLKHKSKNKVLRTYLG